MNDLEEMKILKKCLKINISFILLALLFLIASMMFYGDEFGSYKLHAGMLSLLILHLLAHIIVLKLIISERKLLRVLILVYLVLTLPIFFIPNSFSLFDIIDDLRK